MFPRLQERRKNMGSQLSGGEQQMLSTTRAILGQPAVLLLDEPLEGLAPVICDELLASLLKIVEERRMTMLLVEQQVERALDFAEHLLIMERGRVAWAGTSAQLRDDHSLIERYIGWAFIENAIVWMDSAKRANQRW